MAYKISSLGDIKISSKFDLYIFILGKHGSHTEFMKTLEENLFSLAENINRNALLIVEHNRGATVRRELADKLGSAAFGNNEVIKKFLAKGDALGLSVLITGAHPDKLTDDDLFLLIPILEIDKKFDNTNRFLSELVDFTHNRNTSFLEKFKEEDKSKISFDDILQINPNIYGVGININKLIKALTKKINDFIN